MQLLARHPHWATAKPEQIIDELSNENLFILLEPTASYYEENLPLWQVLQYYGIDNVFSDTENEYVPCKLATHGSEDKHASARYFRTDRETGTIRPAFYCYKCQKRLGAFWYLYTMQRDYEEMNFRDLFKFILTNFGIEPPLDLWRSFDPLTIEIDGTEARIDFAPQLIAAIKIRDIKLVDPRLYLQQLRALLGGGTQAQTE